MGFFNKLKRAFTGEEDISEELDQLAEAEDESGVSDGQLEETAEAPTAEPIVEEESLDSEQEPDTSDHEARDITTVERPVEVVQEKAVEEVVETAEEPIAVADLEEDVIETEQNEVENQSEQTEPEQTESAKKMDKGLKKTRRSFSQVFNELMANFRSVDEDFFEELEETLITADVGFETSLRITDELRKEVKLRNAKKTSDVQKAIAEKMVEIYEEQGTDENNQLNIQTGGLTVMLFVGVNGVGKTTSIGKLANQYRLAGKKVLMAAADTFRAGAIDQLVVWGERAQVEVVRGNAGGDPAAVVFDAVEKAKAQNADILLVDTAGRLQNKVNLMNELEKIKRVIQREIPDGPHEVMLVVDATTGQNAMVQAKQFKETTDVTGLVLTKLDGTAKGGMVLAIRNELNIPVKLVGLGEGIDDLQPFEPKDFINGLFKGLLE